MAVADARPYGTGIRWQLYLVSASGSVPISGLILW